MTDARDPLSAFAAARDSAMRDRLAIALPDARLSFGDLGLLVSAASTRLGALGIERGARVAMPGASDLAAVVTLLALAEIGATPVLLHPRLTAIESKALVSASRAAVTFDLATLATLAEPSAGAVVPAPRAFDDDEPFAIVFTSGTSGTPKQAILPRRAFVASARASAENLSFGPSDGWLSALSLAHVGGLGVITKSLVSGGAVILESKFDAGAALDRIAKGEATLISAVPTMLEALLERDRDGVLNRVRAVLLGGAPASPALLERCASRGVLALATYGLTEACSQVTTQTPRDPRTLELGSGRALAGIDLAIRRENGSICDAHEVGRIAVRGPTMMLGYDAGPDVPKAHAVDDAGWFDTGDIGELDETGRLFVHARRTDLILTGGENVYPAEVEQALEAIAGVRRAVVFGVPDPRWGQIVAVALEFEGDLRIEEVTARAASSLAPHKRPRLGAKVDHVELGPTGKIERKGAFDRYRSLLEPIVRG